MGLIKTAMMSGAAMYGINQIAKTASARQSNQPPRREYSDREYDSQRVRPLEFREPSSRDQHYTENARDNRNHESMFEGEPRQRFYLEEQYPPDYYQPRYTQASYDERPQYEYASNMRSASAPQMSFYPQRRQQGYVESEEIMDGTQRQQGGNGANMVNMLAQQAMSMGLVGGKKDKKDKDSKENLLSSLIGK